MAKEGSKKYNNSLRYHQRRFNEENYHGDDSISSYNKYYYHLGVICDMEKKHRTLTNNERINHWNEARAKVQNEIDEREKQRKVEIEKLRKRK